MSNHLRMLEKTEELLSYFYGPVIKKDFRQCLTIPCYMCTSHLNFSNPQLQALFANYSIKKAFCPQYMQRASYIATILYKQI